ncbi:hypothetical protein NM688_g4270 [Phlebia brevispora]|uniref:Uncharacterized protein n=1 Tax=Phlebia brevispora TaxID=194682 RepID=A0ACC1T3B7_9APHY|nr:hypothetical protein NM688_g4270 [Phlebia brevispora]
MPKPKGRASGRSQQEAATQAVNEQPKLLTTQQKATKTRARYREGEERSQMKMLSAFFVRILRPTLVTRANNIATAATGPRLSKTRAGDKIREWNAPTRKCTISQAVRVPESDVEHEGEPEDSKKTKKLRKKRDPVFVALKNTARVPSSDHSDDDPDLHGWLSDEKPHTRRGGSDENDEDGDLYKPSEESDDTGHIDKSLRYRRGPITVIGLMWTTTWMTSAL